jgi:hypothetical protein
VVRAPVTSGPKSAHDAPAFRTGIPTHDLDTSGVDLIKGGSSGGKLGMNVAQHSDPH